MTNSLIIFKITNVISFYAIQISLRKEIQICVQDLCIMEKKTIVGFNFDIDLSEWEHTVIAEKDRFFIGIKMSDNKYHSFHGINRNGNVGTLLYVHGNDNAQFCGNESCYTIADLTEKLYKRQSLF